MCVLRDPFYSGHSHIRNTVYLSIAERQWNGVVGFKEATAVRNKHLARHAEVIIADITGSEVGFKTCNLHWRQARLLLHTRATTTSLLKRTATQCLALNRHEESILHRTK